MSDLKERFDRAANHVESEIQAGRTFSNDDLLYLYAHYKQSRVGRCNVEKPSVFSLNLSARRKWDAWYGLSHMPSFESMQLYIDRVTELCPGWEADTPSKGQGMGASVSCLKSDEAPLSDSEKTVFDWVKEGRAEPLKELVTRENVNIADPEGMSLLHWAADRGNVDIMRMLIDAGANIDIRDGDGQTALHYAMSCGHQETIRFLLQHGANTDALNSDGKSFLEIDVSEELVQFANKCVIERKTPSS